MSRIAYVNGQYLPQRDAMVNVEDRGYQFADGIYEVVHLHRGTLVDDARHLDRLERSLRELRSPRRWAGRRWCGARGKAGAIGYPTGCLHPDHPRRLSARPRLPDPSVSPALS